MGKDRPHCDCLIELLRVYLVERIVGAVVGVETIKPVLAQRYHWHAGFLQFADILPAGKGWPATMSGKTVTRADLCEAVRRSACREPNPPHSLSLCSKKSRTAWSVAKQ